MPPCDVIAARSMLVACTLAFVVFACLPVGAGDIVLGDAPLAREDVLNTLEASNVKVHILPDLPDLPEVQTDGSRGGSPENPPSNPEEGDPRPMEEKKALAKTLAPGGVRVGLGRPRVWFLPYAPGTVGKPYTGPNRSKSDVYLVDLPFTVYEPTQSDGYFKRVRFTVRLETGKAVVYDMLPKEITASRQVSNKYTLSSDFKFENAGVGMGAGVGAENQIAFQTLEPLISAFGVGQPEVYWLYQQFHDQPVAPGSKHAMLVLDVPKGTKILGAEVFCDLTLGRKQFAFFEANASTRSGYTMSWKLVDAPRAFGR